MKFLLVTYTGLGNFILKTPLVRAISEHFPGAQIHLICGSPWGVEEVLSGSNLIHRTHWCSIKSPWLQKLRILLVLRRQKYDIVLLPFDSTPGYFSRFVWILNPKRVISHFQIPFSSFRFFRISLRLLLGANRHWVPVLTGRHECELNLDLLEPILKLPTERNLQTFVHWEPEDISEFGLNENYIVIQLGASNGEPTPKTWDPQNFFTLINKLREKKNDLQFVLVGDRGDAQLLKKSISDFGCVINLLGMTTFNQLCNVINRARLVVAHDSGAMHVTNALNRPLLALYGPTDFTRTRPLGSKSHILQSRNGCWAKMYSFRSSEADLAEQFQNYYCMSGISVDMVYSKILSILEDSK